MKQFVIMYNYVLFTINSVPRLEITYTLTVKFSLFGICFIVLGCVKWGVW